MTLDTQHVHILYILGFARIDLTYLEQIPKAFSVLNSLPQVSLISRLFALICRKSFTGGGKYFLFTIICLFGAHDVNFYPNSEEEENLLTNVAIVKRSALFQKGMSHI